MDRRAESQGDDRSADGATVSATIKVAVNPKRAEREGASEIEVKCYGPADALAIHKNLDGTGYTITHVVSGLRVFDTRTLRGAKQARAELLTVSGWDGPIEPKKDAAKARMLGELAGNVRSRIVDEGGL